MAYIRRLCQKEVHFQAPDIWNPWRQPRPQGFSLKKWVNWPQEFIHYRWYEYLMRTRDQPMPGPFPSPTHFLREKPRGRGCREGDVNLLKWKLAFYFFNPELEFVVSSQNNTCSVSGQVFLMQLTDKIVLTFPHAHIMLILKHNHKSIYTVFLSM